MHARPGHHLTLTLCSVLLISKSRMSIVNTPTWFSTSSWWNWLKLLNTNHTDWIPTHRSTLRLPSSRRTLARVGSRVAWDSRGSKCWACLNRLAMQMAALALSLTSSSYKFSCSTCTILHRVFSEYLTVWVVQPVVAHQASWVESTDECNALTSCIRLCCETCLFCHMT